MFGNVAIMILCAVFFLVPFALRGARMAVQDIRNEVTDWLPSDFPETEVLQWFRPRFVGDQFVAVSWDECRRGELAYDAFVSKLQSESVEGQNNLSDAEAKIKEIADELALQQTDEKYHSDWGQNGERWLMGRKGQWYYITKVGQLFKWTGKNNAFAMASRGVAQFLNGKFEVKGEPENRIPADPRFYENPKLLCARFFLKIQSGPEILEELISEDGPLKSMQNAELEAHKRLTGTLFGPTPSTSFDWNDPKNSFLKELTKSQLSGDRNSIAEEFETYVISLAKNPEKGHDYNGDPANINKALQEKKFEHWYNFFKKIDMKLPPRQTAIVVVLNSPILGELDRVVGRDILGKPMGRLRYLAANECDISKDELHLGGPPCDNVAIDEEGTITLVRLVGLSSLVGVIIAYLSFKSVLVTIMVFFVGGVSAISSMGIVWYSGSQLDAILLTMPSLVYVLGLSGAVHIVNYYRESCYENGHRGAAETAVRYGWFPCTLAALTTSLGLISLYVSNLIPIKKFGLFSAIGTMVTVTLLFTYLPASLKLFPPGYKKRRQKDIDAKKGRSLYDLTNDFWSWVGRWVTKRHTIVTVSTIILMLVVGLGIFKIKTSVQLLKLFDPSADVVQDYVWMENNLGKLVPMEIVLGFDRDALDNDEDYAGPEINFREAALKYSRVDRIDAGSIVRSELERAFGEEGQNIVGKGMEIGDFLPFDDKAKLGNSIFINDTLSQNQDSLAKTGLTATEKNPTAEANYGYEFWRVSLRLGALNNVDYGLFVSDIKKVVEPIITAYRYRSSILKQLTEKFEKENLAKGEELGPKDKIEGSVLLLGYDRGSDPSLTAADPETFLWKKEHFNQTQIFSRTIKRLLNYRGFNPKRPGATNQSKILAAFRPKKGSTPEALDQKLANADCVVLIQGHEMYDLEAIKKRVPIFIDARDHQFPENWTNEDIVTTRENRMTTLAGNPSDNASPVDDVDVVATYSGIVPIVYKAQRSLLKSLIDSICLAFVMIAFVMMLLLRDWKQKVSLKNSLNVTGGLVSMLPNIFPVVLIFGLMGHLGREVDIGSMMTASVAMGVAVDDTIHFLNWFRKGLRDGMDRVGAVQLAYKRCGAAMTQTTLIGGLGLSVFGLSTFTPTQGFGVLMLFLLIAALLGDLIFLPAILVGPLGKLFQFNKPVNGSGRTDRSDSPVVLSTRKQLEALDSDIESRDAETTQTPVTDGRQTTPHSNLRDSRQKKLESD